MKHYILRKKTARLVFIYYILRLLFFVVAPAYNKHRVAEREKPVPFPYRSIVQL